MVARSVNKFRSNSLPALLSLPSWWFLGIKFYPSFFINPSSFYLFIQPFRLFRDLIIISPMILVVRLLPLYNSSAIQSCFSFSFLDSSITIVSLYDWDLNYIHDAKHTLFECPFITPSDTLYPNLPSLYSL